MINDPYDDNYNTCFVCGLLQGFCNGHDDSEYDLGTCEGCGAYGPRGTHHYEYVSSLTGMDHEQECGRYC